MGAQVLVDVPSGRTNALLEKPLLDGDRQAVGQHADEDGPLRKGGAGVLGLLRHQVLPVRL